MRIDHAALFCRDLEQSDFDKEVKRWRDNGLFDDKNE